SEQLKRRSNSARIFARSKVAVRWTALTASGDRIRAALLRLLASGFGRFCCRSRRRRKRPLAPSYRLSLPLARESGGWGLLYRFPTRFWSSRHACRRERRRPCHELGQPAQVLSDCCQRELELRPAWLA